MCKHLTGRTAAAAIAGGLGVCRFCGTSSKTGLLAIGNVCPDEECQVCMN